MTDVLEPIASAETADTPLSRFRPYPEYKDSGVEWLGEVPSHWDVVRIRDACKIINGATPKSDVAEFWDGDIPWVTPDDLGQLTDIYIQTTQRNITRAGYESCGTQLSPGGSIVLSTRAPIGHIAISKMGLCTNQGCRILVPRHCNSPLFLYYLLFAARSELQAAGQGTTFRELTKDRLASVHIPYASLAEQNLITSFLDRETAKIDALIARKERFIELLEEQRSAVISHAVTKGLDPNVPMKDSGVEWIGEVPDGWRVEKLKYLSNVPLQYGANEAAELANPLAPRFIRITDIDEHGELRGNTFKSLPEDIAAPYLLQQGDILFARSGATVGKTVLYRSAWGRACFAGYLIRFRSNPYTIVPEFLRYYSQSNGYWSWIASINTQATIQNVSADKYANLQIGVPPIDEQQLIVAFLDREAAKVNEMIEKTTSAISLLREYRTALISAAVTGKIDVRGEVAA